MGRIRFANREYVIMKLLGLGCWWALNYNLRNICIFVLAAGCFLSCGDPEKGARAVLSEAYLLAEGGHDQYEKHNFAEALKAYDNVITLVNNIPVKYPSSAIAEEFVKNTLRIGNVPFEEIESKIIPRLQLLNAATQDPIATAYLIAEKETDADKRISDYSSVADVASMTNRPEIAKAAYQKSATTFLYSTNVEDREFLIGYLISLAYKVGSTEFVESLKTQWISALNQPSCNCGSDELPYTRIEECMKCTKLLWVVTMLIQDAHDTETALRYYDMAPKEFREKEILWSVGDMIIEQGAYQWLIPVLKRTDSPKRRLFEVTQWVSQLAKKGEVNTALTLLRAVDNDASKVDDPDELLSNRLSLARNYFFLNSPTDALRHFKSGRDLILSLPPVK